MKTTAITRIQGRAAHTALATLVVAVIALALVHLAPEKPATAADSPRDIFSTSPGSRDLRTGPVPAEPGKPAIATAPRKLAGRGSVGDSSKQRMVIPLTTGDRLLMASGGNDVAIEAIVIAHEGFERASTPRTEVVVRQQGRVLLDADLNGQ